jgi:hypothetical protein
MRARTGTAALLALIGVTLAGCAMQRHREQVRQGFLTRGLHRKAFLLEWGAPDRTFTVQGKDPVLRVQPFYQTYERPVYEIWEYQARATCLTFYGVRLVSWKTGRTDCEPRPRAEQPEGRRETRPPPMPPYPD